MWRAALLSLCLGLGLSLAPAGAAKAEKVGVAAAVNPDAFSSLSETPNKQLNIGKSIFYNERINTSGSGLVQVLLVDGSTFTVGPNSDLVIDKFVYDPRKKTGEMIATFSKGTMRFIGGKLSKNDGGVKVNTPAGVLAIRGGMFDARVTGRKGIFAFRYGVSLTYTGNGVRREVFEKGYVLDLTGNSIVVRPSTPQDTQLFQSAFSGGGTVVVPGQDNQPDNQLALTETISLQDLISDATAERINNSLEQEETQTQNNDTPSNNNNPPPPTQVTVRVLNPAGTYTAFPGSPGSTFTTDNNQSILGGDPNATVDDFVRTFSIVNGRLVGTVTGLTDSSLGQNNNPVTEPLSDATVNFPAQFQCDPNLCLAFVTDATISQSGNIDNYVGQFVGRPGFFSYHLARGEIIGQDLVIDPVEPEPILAFGGTAHNFGTPSGKLYQFVLFPDALADSPAPFSSAKSMPLQGFGLGATSTTPLVLLTEDSDPDSQAVWLQSSFYIGTASGEDSYGQQSFVNIALGGMSEDGGLIGARRGGSYVDVTPTYNSDHNGPTRDFYAFTGDVATLAGPNGSHFLGTEDPNIVIGLDSTGEAHNIGRDIPLTNPNNSSVANQSGATYHVGIGIGPVDEPLSQNSGTFEGYAAGFVQRPGNGAPETLLNTSQNDVTLSLDADTNTMTASIGVGNGAIFPNPRYNLEFGGEGNSAFIDDGIFAAFETPGASKIEETVPVRYFNLFGVKIPIEWEEQHYDPDVQGYIVSADAINANAQLFPKQNPDDIQKQAFCQDCKFIKWGAWGARMNYDNYDGPVTEDVHLGWWIAGDVVSPSDIPIQGSAFYAGDAIGTVARKLDNGGWNQYVATGKFDVDWKFAKRRGDFTISNFDGKNFGGRLKNPAGTSTFSTKLLDLRNVQNGIATQANGAFVGSRPGQAPAGMIGNFQANQLNNKWKANGIFGATIAP